MSQNENSNNAFAIESHSIDYVAPSERNGKVRDLFTLWFLYQYCTACRDYGCNVNFNV